MALLGDPQALMQDGPSCRSRLGHGPLTAGVHRRDDSADDFIESVPHLGSDSKYGRSRSMTWRDAPRAEEQIESDVDASGP